MKLLFDENLSRKLAQRLADLLDLLMWLGLS